MSSPIEPIGGSPRAGRYPRSINLLALGSLLVWAVLAFCQPAWAQKPPTESAAALRAKFLELQAQMRSNIFKEPLYLSSRDEANRSEGDVYAEVVHPFAQVGAAFKSGATVCELLFLHLNVRACLPAPVAGGESLALSFGPKRATAPGLRYQMSYVLRIEASEPAYLRATLTAAEGPLSTRDHRIVVEVAAIDASRSVVHLGYAYNYGVVARMAMQVYLATVGRSKIGFTVMGQEVDGRPQYVRGERASIERNVMRYYFAVLACSNVKTGSVQERTETRLRGWFALTERYAEQLHELDLDEYLQEKHDDLAAAALKKGANS